MSNGNRIFLFLGVAIMFVCAVVAAYWVGSGIGGGNPVVASPIPVVVPQDTVTPLTTTASVTPFVSGRKLSDSALELAKADNPNAYTFVTTHDAEILPLDAGNTYAVWWQPEGFDPAKDTIVVSLHGHGDWAIQDFKVWYPEISARGYAFIGLQWWLGRSLEDVGYYEIPEMYQLITSALAAKGITDGNIIFQGFSMGGARSYGVVFEDQQSGKPLFDVDIANSGPWEDNYPLYASILKGDYGATPFAGTQWILYCGAKDINEHPSTPELAIVCDGMTHTKDILEGFGATVPLFIDDATGDHGSFMRNPTNVESALDVADGILSTK
ncbi:MAG: hypothetical protein AAB473_02775 [Patescibacteria group bacterium]